jgi:hypothetical protein
MTLADSCQLLHARWSNVTSSRSAAWIGNRSTVRIGAVGAMAARLLRDSWPRMGVVTAKNKRDAALAEQMCRSDMGLLIWIYTLTPRFLRWQCGHWQREIRSGRRHASSRSTKTRFVHGWIGQHNTAAWSCSSCGETSMSSNASWTNSGALCIPSNAIYRLLDSMMRPMALRGCGSPLHRCGGWCWLS